MAIRLRVKEQTVRFRITSDKFHLKATEGIPIYPETYTGETSVTPSEEEQVLLTNGLYVPSNITVAPIPSNYGKITYNGSTIVVS